MKLSFRSLLIAGTCLAASGVSYATSVGYTDYSSLLGSNASWSLWDVFPGGGVVFGSTKAASFSSLSDSSGTSDAVLSASFSGGNPGALLIPDADGTENSQLYTGGSTTSFTISAITTGTLSTFVLQVKQNGANPSGGTDTSGLTSYFTPTLNGIAFTNATVGSAFADPTSATTSDWVITTWSWSGLNISEGELITLSFGGAFAHKSLDGVRIDVDAGLAVPEPSTYALIALGLGAVVWMARRRSSVAVS